MSNTIQGQVTIRAHKAEAILATEFDNRQDSHTSAWYSYLSVTRWFSCWMELLLLAFIAKLLVAAVLVSEGKTWILLVPLLIRENIVSYQ